jgi:hypothetical protein
LSNWAAKLFSAGTGNSSELLLLLEEEEDRSISLTSGEWRFKMDFGCSPLLDGDLLRKMLFISVVLSELFRRKIPVCFFNFE